MARHERRQHEHKQHKHHHHEGHDDYGFEGRHDPWAPKQAPKSGWWEGRSLWFWLAAGLAFWFLSIMITGH